MTDTGINLDQWSPLDHLVGMGETAGELDYAPPYLDSEQKRRINAYARLRAYIETVRRYYLPDDPDNENLEDEWREFGDPGLYVARVAAAIIGDDAYIAVEGADTPTADRPDIPIFPAAPGEDLEPEEQAIREQEYAIRVNQWIIESQTELERWQMEVSERPSLDARQDWLQKWADSDRIMAKIKQMEVEYVVPLGSGVIELHWDQDHNRVSAEVHSPEAYFPVLNDSYAGEFPLKVHLAWIFEEPDESGEPVEYVRRITYELVPVEADDLVIEALGIDPADDVGQRPAYLTGDEQWRWSCLYSNGVWLLDDFETLPDINKGVRWTLIDDPAGGDTPIEAERIPLGLDFIPLIHVSNTDNYAGHFGRPLFIRQAQLLDEIAGSDMDEALSSRWAAKPPVALSGLEPGTDTIEMLPGQAVKLREGGRMTTVDMAGNQREIRERIRELLRRLSVNLQVPEGLVGRVDASDVPSGVAFTLSFTAFEQLINDARLARKHKYELLFKMVQRMAVVHGDESLIDPEFVYKAGIHFGAFMPTDLIGIANIISLMIQAKAMSQETAITWLKSAGVPSEDLSAELKSIRFAFMTEEADRMAEALGDSKWAALLMGIDGWEPPESGDETISPLGAPPQTEEPDLGGQ